MDTPNDFKISVIWTPWEDQGLEHLTLARRLEGWLADGVIIFMKEGAVFRARYQIDCDARWSVRQMRIDLLDNENKSVSFNSDGNGCWRTEDGERVEHFDGCLDVDISATPFTNTLPIRRGNLKEGESLEVLALYVILPGLEIKPARQRYTCLTRHTEQSVYRYESVSTGFMADLTVDLHGLVIDYPGLFRRTEE